ncbi:MAG: hypothetical protein J7L20_03950 [Thermoplasmata archaeon]|nr:hypothetical protein [Thermoplasmata archaeon]
MTYHGIFILPDALLARVIGFTEEALREELIGGMGIKKRYSTDVPRSFRTHISSWHAPSPLEDNTFDRILIGGGGSSYDIPQGN